MCEKCCAEGPIINGDTSMTWETRPIEDALRAELEQERKLSTEGLTAAFMQGSHESRKDCEAELARKDELIAALEELSGRLNYESSIASELAEHLEKIGVLSKEQADSFRSAQSETQAASARLAELRTGIVPKGGV